MHPIGWPSATAPPLTLTLLSRVGRAVEQHPRRVQGDRCEGLVDLDEVEVARPTAPPSSAPTEWRAQEPCGGREALRRTCRERRSRPSESAQAPRARSALITTTAAPPFDTCDALPAVIVPSVWNAGVACRATRLWFPLARPHRCRTRPGRLCAAGLREARSPRRTFRSAIALAARSWLRAAHASCSSRPIENSVFTSSD